MRQSSVAAVAELAVLVSASAIAVLLPSAPFAPNDLVWFVAGISVLKLSDVWLPRGDTIDMSSSLALGALLLFDTRFVLTVLVIAEVLALAPKGREQKWRLALAVVAAESAATVICSAVLVPLGLHPLNGVLTNVAGRLRPEQYVFVLLVGLLFAALEHGLLQLEMAYRDRRPVRATMLGSLSHGGWLVAAQASAGVLVALMYRTMGVWGLLVGVVMILVMRQSFVLLLDIRQAYDATIGVLIRAMEAQRPGREGLAARNADLSLKVGRGLGMHGRDLERIRYAALLLGLGSEDNGPNSLRLSAPSWRIIDGVDFLSDVAPILHLCDDPEGSSDVRRGDLACSYVVVAVAVATDTVPATRLEALSRRVGPRMTREVDVILATAEAAASDDALAGGEAR